MKIVLDGDSVAEERNNNWPSILSGKLGIKIVNISEHRSTTHEVLFRMRRVFYDPPDLYMLQMGQWSSHHEGLFEFVDGMRKIVAYAHTGGAKVCLITPPSLDTENSIYAQVIREVATEYNTLLADMHKITLDRSCIIDPEEVIPCHLNAKGSELVMPAFNELLKHPYQGLV